MVLAQVLPILFAVGSAIVPVLPVLGGICWSSVNENGRCTDMLSLGATKEQCCRQFPDVSTAWSPNDLDSGSLFFLRVLGGGVPCLACKETCRGVDCGQGKKCAVRGGRPKCICAPSCKERGRAKGPVCGSDGRSYRNICRLKKRACRKRSLSLSVAYHGFCQSTCDRISCPTGKFCLLDQNLSPHCVQCSPRCPSKQASKPVCGADGVTYINTCVLRETACRRGKAIPVAYKGPCKETANCGSVRCRERQACLVEPESQKPRCVTCATHCSRPNARDFGGPLCGSNNRTYLSWCHMVRDACATGYVIETAFTGPCTLESSGGGLLFFKNTVLDDDDEKS